jgi:predicted oxidoreductase
MEDQMSDSPLVRTKHHKLGNSQLMIGPLAYGCWRLAGKGALSGQVKAAAEKINTALHQNMTLIDTADIYGSRWPDGFGEAEELLGLVLAADKSLRGRMVLASKGGIVPGLPYDSTKAYLVNACEASLKRLGTEVIDLYQIHRPDLLAHPAEVATALTQLREQGKIREVGVSNYTPAQTRALQAHLDFRIVSQQPELSAAAPDAFFDGVTDWCMETGAFTLAWSPLGGGALLGTGSGTPALAPVIKVLDTLADRHGTDRAAIALAFLLAHPASVIPIIGTQTPERIRKAADALDVGLTRREWYDILEARLGRRMP